MKIMRGLVILAILVVATWAIEIDLKKTYNDAIEKLEYQLMKETLEGKVSSRFNRKKFTPYSREMAQRNAIFKEIYATLKNEVEPEEARKLAQKSISENRAAEEILRRAPTGQAGRTRLANILNDACLGVEPECDESTMFRTITGKCNNLKKPFLGSMSNAFPREIAVEEYNPKVDFTVYDDLAQSRHGSKGGSLGSNDRSVNGASIGSGTCPRRQGTNLPSPRTVSQIFHTHNDVPAEVTHMLTQWGQFLDHDITLTPENEDQDCCPRPFNASDECFPITVSSNDAFYSANGVDCLEFSRSVAYCEENGGARQQLNAITSFVDASNVYGSDDSTSMALRSLVDGKLLMGENNLLPIIEKDDGPEESAGDVRALEMPGLAAMHTVWVREHNRIADLVKATDSALSDQEIYQHARRIVNAEYQNVIYGEYLPIVLGRNNMDGLELNVDGSSYDEHVDPSITNEFATATFRFGHSMIQGLIKMFALDNSGEVDEYPLSENFFNTERYYYQNGLGMEQILMGLVTQPAQTADKDVTEEVSDFLFREAGANFGQDLISRNLQRGRDHGIPGFCCYLELWDDSRVNCSDDWSTRYSDISDDAWTALQSVYEKPSDIDLFTGGMAQAAYNGGLTGRVFNRQLADQFKRVKDGDRFFFTHQGETSSFTRDARQTLMSRTLAGIICDNTNISAVPSNVFLVTDPSNFVNCSEAPSLGNISELMRSTGHRTTESGNSNEVCWEKCFQIEDTDSERFRGIYDDFYRMGMEARRLKTMYGVNGTAILIDSNSDNKDKADSIFELQKNLASIVIMLMGSDNSNNPTSLLQFNEMHSYTCENFHCLDACEANLMIRDFLDPIQTKANYHKDGNVEAACGQANRYLQTTTCDAHIQHEMAIAVLNSDIYFEGDSSSSSSSSESLEDEPCLAHFDTRFAIGTHSAGWDEINKFRSRRAQGFYVHHNEYTSSAARNLVACLDASCCQSAISNLTPGECKITIGKYGETETNYNFQS